MPIRFVVVPLPATSRNWTNVARAYFQAGKLTDAEKFYRKALSIDPHDWKAMGGMAATLKKVGKKAEAKELMRRLLD